MDMTKIKLLHLCLAAYILLITAPGAFAAANSSILYTEKSLGNGLWQYDYIFNNTSTTESLYSVYFYFAQETSFTGTAQPSGWNGIVWDGDTWITDFADIYSTGSSFDIPAGNSLSGFSFTVDYQAGNIPYDVFFNGDIVVSGTTAPMPAVVPEPVNSTLFIIGGTLLTGIRYLRRKKIT